MERAVNEAEWREVEEALRRAEELERLEVQWLATERRIKALERMEDELLEAELQQETNLRQEAKLRRPWFETTEEGGVSGTGASE